MELSLFLDFIIITAFLFWFKTKNYHIVQYLFVFLINVFLYSSFISIIADNLELWKVKEEVMSFMTFRLSEIILFPVLTLWFIEFFFIRKDLFYRVILFCLFLCLPVGIERWLVHIEIIQMEKWEWYETVGIWFFFYLFSLFIHYIVGKFLIKEGMWNGSTSA